MKNFTLILILLIAPFVYGQKFIPMDEVLSNINGHVTIDGNTLQAEYDTKDQIIITGTDMVINERSSFLLNNVILQLTGDVIVKGPMRPVMIDSYIFCNKSKVLQSNKIIESNNYNDVIVGEVEYIKNLPENSEIWLYNSTGKRIFKGMKNETHNFSVPISRYDVKVVGKSFKDKVLFFN